MTTAFYVKIGDLSVTHLIDNKTPNLIASDYPPEITDDTSRAAFRAHLDTIVETAVHGEVDEFYFRGPGGRDQHHYGLSMKVTFDRPDDAIAFKLRWADEIVGQEAQ